MGDCALIAPVYLEIALFSGARSGAKWRNKSTVHFCIVGNKLCAANATAIKKDTPTLLPKAVRCTLANAQEVSSAISIARVTAESKGRALRVDNFTRS